MVEMDGILQHGMAENSVSQNARAEPNPPNAPNAPKDKARATMTPPNQPYQSLDQSPDPLTAGPTVAEKRVTADRSAKTTGGISAAEREPVPGVTYDAVSSTERSSISSVLRFNYVAPQTPENNLSTMEG